MLFIILRFIRICFINVVIFKIKHQLISNQIYIIRIPVKVRHDLGTNTTAKDCSSGDCPAEPVTSDSVGAMYSKVVDPSLLPAMKAQRDPKTGQLKDEPAFIKHRMDLFDQLYKE